VTRARSIIVLVVVVFAVYAVLTSPDQSASVVKDAVGRMGDGLTSIGKFFSALMN
jgi:hypothetical protein